MRKILCLISAVLLLLTAMPLGAFASEADEPITVIADNFHLGFTGTWGHMNNLDNVGITGYYLDTASSTTEDNTSFDYTFTDCTQIFWYANYNPVYALVDIHLDGELYCTLDCGKLGYASTPSLVWESPILERGTHTIRVVRRDDESNKGKYFEVDRLEATCYSSSQATLNDTGLSYFNFVSGFERVDDATALGHTTHVASESDSWFTLSFWGDFVDLYGSMEGGEADVYLNGVKKTTITDTNGYGKLCSVSGLEDDMYTLKVVLRSGTLKVDYATTTHPYNAATEIYRLGKEAVEQMENGTKGYIPENEWEPVEKSATYPLNGVELQSGLYYDAFMKNVDMIKRSAKLKNYVQIESVWIENFPSSNEGRVLSAAANSLRFMQDEELDQIVRELLDKATARKKDSGYCLPEPEEWYDGLFLSSDNPYVSVDECKNYGRVMYTQGLLAAGQAGYEEGYTLLRGLYDWLNDCDYKEYLLPGSLGIQGIVGATLCYGSPVGEAQDLITNMQYYEMEWYLDYLARAMPEAMYKYPLDRPHAYMATAARAFLDMYGATGADMYLEAALGAWTIFEQYYVTPGGAVCMCEGITYTPGNYNLSHASRSVYETCNNVLWADLNHTLLQYFPTQERFAHYLEQSLNVVFAAQATNGEIRYMNHMTDKKDGHGIVNTCCEVQGARQLSQVPQFIYSLSKNEIYLNLYSDSVLSFDLEGASGKLDCDTSFPYGNDVSLKLDLEREGEFSVFVRVPAWSPSAVDITLNGERVANGVPGEYVEIKHSFKDGDTIAFTLPMEFELIKYVGNSQIEGEVRYGIMYGPIFMAVVGPANKDCVQPGGEKIAKLAVTPEEFVERITLKDASKLTFTIDGASGYTLKPYYSVTDNERFDCFPVLLKESVIEVSPTPTPDSTESPSVTAEPTTAPTPQPQVNIVLIICIAVIVLAIATVTAVLIIKKKK